MLITQTYIHVNLNSQDIINLGAMNIGNQNTNGAWRIKADDSRLVIERREGGTWITKGVFWGEKPDFDGIDFDSSDFQTSID